jgi:hypothetical protein
MTANTIAKVTRTIKRHESMARLREPNVEATSSRSTVLGVEYDLDLRSHLACVSRAE